MAETITTTKEHAGHVEFALPFVFLGPQLLDLLVVTSDFFSW